MPELGSMLNFLCRYLIMSYPLIGYLFFRCLSMIMSMKLWIILRLRVYAASDSSLDAVSKCIYVLEYNSMCLLRYSYNNKLIYRW